MLSIPAKVLRVEKHVACRFVVSLFVVLEVGHKYTTLYHKGSVVFCLLVLRLIIESLSLDPTYHESVSLLRHIISLSDITVVLGHMAFDSQRHWSSYNTHNLFSYCFHIVFILFSYCFHIVFIFFSYLFHIFFTFCFTFFFTLVYIVILYDL